jgi:hypothetical protein
MLKLEKNFYALEWPSTFQNDLERPWSTSPCNKEHLISTTSISDERFRRLAWTDTMATAYAP